MVQWEQLNLKGTVLLRIIRFDKCIPSAWLFV